MIGNPKNVDSVSAAQFSCVPRLFTARFFGRMGLLT